jgi:hypothetical protein
MTSGRPVLVNIVTGRQGHAALLVAPALTHLRKSFGIPLPSSFSIDAVDARRVGKQVRPWRVSQRRTVPPCHEVPRTRIGPLRRRSHYCE